MNAANKGKAAAIAEVLSVDFPCGGVLVLVFDESAIHVGATPDGHRLGVIEVDGAFRTNPAAVHTASGLDAIRRLGNECGDAARDVIARVTAELGGVLARSNDSRDPKP